MVTPLRVVLIRVWSIPRINKAVAPRPLPDSEVTTTEGIISNRLLTLPLPCSERICGIDIVVRFAEVCTVGLTNSMVTSWTLPLCTVSGCCANTVPGITNNPVKVKMAQMTWNLKPGTWNLKLLIISLTVLVNKLNTLKEGRETLWNSLRRHYPHQVQRVWSQPWRHPFQNGGKDTFF